MENILLRFFREVHLHSPESVAGYLHISAGDYKSIEKGEIPLTAKQARQLGKLYNIQGNYFYDAALQPDLLLTKTETGKIQKAKIRQMAQQLQQLQAIRGRMRMLPGNSFSRFCYAVKIHGTGIKCKHSIVTIGLHLIYCYIYPCKYVALRSIRRNIYRDNKGSKLFLIYKVGLEFSGSSEENFNTKRRAITISNLLKPVAEPYPPALPLNPVHSNQHGLQQERSLFRNAA